MKSPRPKSSRPLTRPALVLAAVTSMASLQSGFAQTALNPGDVKILGYNSNAPDGFSFVLLKDVAANTVIKFTDNGFLSANATATGQFRGGENFFSIRFNGAASAGTVVRVIDSPSSPGNVSASPGYTGTFNHFNTLSGVSVSGDQIFIYQGANFGDAGTVSNVNVSANSNPATFSGSLIYGLTFGTTSPGWLTSGTPSTNTSYLPSVLAGTDHNIQILQSSNVVGQYTGARSGLTQTLYATAVSNQANWTLATSGTTTLDTTPLTAAASASIYWDSNGTNAGTGGGGTWDTTTQSRFKNVNADTATYFRWVNSSTGNAHTPIFAGTAGTVSVASGGVTVAGIQFDSTGYAINNNVITLEGVSPTITVNGSPSLATVGSQLAGSSGLVKSGPGTLVLASANTYTGATTISEGTLRVNGSLASGSAVTVNSAGTLAGSGTVSGTVAVDGSGKIAPGGSVGTLTTGNWTSFASTGTLVLDLDAVRPVRLGGVIGNFSGANPGHIGGGINDYLVVGTLPSALSLTIDVDQIGLTSFSGLADGTFWTVLTFAGAAPTLGTVSFVDMPSLGVGQSWGLFVDGQNLNLQIIPEPMVIATTGIISCYVGLRRRRVAV